MAGIPSARGNRQLSRWWRNRHFLSFCVSACPSLPACAGIEDNVCICLFPCSRTYDRSRRRYICVLTCGRQYGLPCSLPPILRLWGLLRTASCWKLPPPFQICSLVSWLKNCQKVTVDVVCPLVPLQVSAYGCVSATCAVPRLGSV